MRKIAVEVEQLESCAARMEEKNQDYLHHSIGRNNVECMEWRGQSCIYIADCFLRI